MLNLSMMPKWWWRKPKNRCNSSCNKTKKYI